MAAAAAAAAAARASPTLRAQRLFIDTAAATHRDRRRTPAVHRSFSFTAIDQPLSDRQRKRQRKRDRERESRAVRDIGPPFSVVSSWPRSDAKLPTAMTGGGRRVSVQEPGRVNGLSHNATTER